MKAATECYKSDSATVLFQSTPPVKAATRILQVDLGGGEISIHAAREGGDHLCNNVKHLVNISIHAAREGGDYTGRNGDSKYIYFNPRRP